jgi:hypothetical protein
MLTTRTNAAPIIANIKIIHGKFVVACPTVLLGFADTIVVGAANASAEVTDGVNTADVNGESESNTIGDYLNPPIVFN